MPLPESTHTSTETDDSSGKKRINSCVRSWTERSWTRTITFMSQRTIDGHVLFSFLEGSVCSLRTHEESGAVHWTFDNHASNPSSSNVSARFVNNASCTEPGIRGYGAALFLSASLNQHVIIDYKFNLKHTSFTVTVWINYREDLQDMGIVGQCEKSEKSTCLHLNIRDQKAYLGFFSNDLHSKKILKKNRWYHLAFVYNNHSQHQLIYLDGILSDSHRASGPYLGNATEIEIGRGLKNRRRFFDGLIDRVSLLNRVMSDDEIREQATLVVSYSFNQTIDSDSGPNQITASAVNVSLTAGVASESLLFNQTDAYFEVRNLVLLADTDRSHSYSFWIYPFINHTDLTLIHVIFSGGWCSPIIGFDAGQQLAALISNRTDQHLVGPNISTETWTHIALVYEESSQFTLYINGSMRCQRKSYYYAPDREPLTLTIGKNINHTCLSRHPGHFRGKIDEFRLYARSLNSSDVQHLVAHWNQSSVFGTANSRYSPFFCPTFLFVSSNKTKKNQTIKWYEYPWLASCVELRCLSVDSYQTTTRTNQI